MSIDWGNAPTGSTHFVPKFNVFVRRCDYGWFCWEGNGWVLANFDPSVWNRIKGSLVPKPSFMKTNNSERTIPIETLQDWLNDLSIHGVGDIQTALDIEKIIGEL